MIVLSENKSNSSLALMVGLEMPCQQINKIEMGIYMYYIGFSENQHSRFSRLDRSALSCLLMLLGSLNCKNMDPDRTAPRIPLPLQWYKTSYMAFHANAENLFAIARSCFRSASDSSRADFLYRRKHLLAFNRNCLGQFRVIPQNKTTDVHRGSTLRVIT